MTEEEVDVERALVRLVDDDRVVVAEHRVALHFGKEHAIGEKLHDGVARGLVVEPDFAADFAAPLDPEFLRHAARDGERGDAARLRAGDAARDTATGREAHLRDLRRFAGAGLTGENHHRIILDGRGDFLRARGDRQLGWKLETERER